MNKKIFNCILLFIFITNTNKKEDPIKEKEEMIEEVFKPSRKTSRKENKSEKRRS